MPKPPAQIVSADDAGETLMQFLDLILKADDGFLEVTEKRLELVN